MDKYGKNEVFCAASKNFVFAARFCQICVIHLLRLCQFLETHFSNRLRNTHQRIWYDFTLTPVWVMKIVPIFMVAMQTMQRGQTFFKDLC